MNTKQTKQKNIVMLHKEEHNSGHIYIPQADRQTDETSAKFCIVFEVITFVTKVSKCVYLCVCLVFYC